MKLSRSFQKESEPKLFKFSQCVNTRRNFFGFVDKYIFCTYLIGLYTIIPLLHVVHLAVYDYSIVAHVIHLVL